MNIGNSNNLSNNKRKYDGTSNNFNSIAKKNKVNNVRNNDFDCIVGFFSGKFTKSKLNDVFVAVKYDKTVNFFAFLSCVGRERISLNDLTTYIDDSLVLPEEIRIAIISILKFIPIPEYTIRN